MAESARRAVAVTARVLNVPEQAVRQVEQIKAGLTNESWLVAGAGEQLVVRFSTADEQSLQIDRMSECRVLAAVQEAGVGPEVLLCEPHERLLVTRYLPGRTWDGAEAAHPDNIRRLAVLLRRLHSTPAPDDIAGISLPHVLEGYWATLERGGRPLPEGDWNRDELREVASALSDGSVHCLCHNDVHHLNLVDTGRLWLLDWEYAGIGDPYFDLASLCCYHAYGEAERRQLLHHYLGHDDDAACARLDLACWLFDYIRRLWLLVRGPILPTRS